MLVKIQKDENGNQLVSAREVYEYLEVKRDFTTWIKARIEKIGFQENIDFTKVWNDPKTGDVVNIQGTTNSMVKKGYRTDYIITASMAKHLGMMERNPKGNEIRDYFMECEKKANELILKDNSFENGTLEFIYEKLLAIKNKEDKIQNLRERITELQTEVGKEYSNIRSVSNAMQQDTERIVNKRIQN